MLFLLVRRALLVLVLVLCACVRNPVTLRPQLFALSERQEVVLGRQALDTFKRTHPFIAGGPLALLVRRTGDELAAVAPESSYAYSFHVLDTGEANAFALPGGVIMVTRGLLLVCNDVDDLAGVLGHEIGHVSARHAAARSTWFAHMPQLLTAPYERGQEREADRIGATLAASMGYDPLGLARTLARLEVISAAAAQGSLPMAASHPSTPARLDLMRILAVELERAPRQERADLLAALDGLAVDADASRAALHGSAALFPEHGVRMTFPEAWIKDLGEQTFLAVAPAGAAVLRLRVQTAAEAQTDQASIDAEPGRVETVTLPSRSGWHVTRRVLHYGQGGVARWYWLARGGTVLQLVGDWHVSADAQFAAVLDAVVFSLRPLVAADLAGLTLTRLRLATALPGETLVALAARAKSVWSAAEIAAYNGLEVATPLAAGCVLKVARSEPLARP